MYEVKYTRRFLKDIKLCQKRNYDLNILKRAIELLAKDGVLPSSYYPHKLVGDYRGSWECHLKGDWIMIWEQDDSHLTLLFTGTGTHSDLFK